MATSIAYAEAVSFLKEIDTLAIYNAEVYRGLVHTEDYAAKMAELQRRFDERTRRTA